MLKKKIYIFQEEKRIQHIFLLFLNMLYLYLSRILDTKNLSRLVLGKKLKLSIMFHSFILLFLPFYYCLFSFFKIMFHILNLAVLCCFAVHSPRSESLFFIYESVVELSWVRWTTRETKILKLTTHSSHRSVQYRYRAFSQ